MKEVNMYPHYNNKLQRYSIYTGWIGAYTSILSTYNRTYILIGDAWDEVSQTFISDQITLNSFL